MNIFKLFGSKSYFFFKKAKLELSVSFLKLKIIATRLEGSSNLILKLIKILDLNFKSHRFSFGSI